MHPIGLLLVLAAQGGPTTKPIIAVFPIEDRRGKLSASDVGQLTDYFGTKIAETSRFLVVPRSDIEAALTGQKARSYQECFDEACQIEIGKAVAAQKVLHTRIVQVGNLCAVTATLYDLRLSATESAASAKSACDTDALVGALEEVATKVTGGAAKPAPPPPPTTGAQPKPAPATFSLRIDSTPAQSRVLVDGTDQGRTPVTLKLPKNAPQKITVERSGFESFTETVTLDRDQRRHVDLKMTAERRASRTEWFGLSVGFGGSLSGAFDISLWLRFFNLHLGSLTITVLEAAGGPVFTHALDRISDCQNDQDLGYCRELTIAPKLYLGPRAGYKILFGEEHNLELSLGGGLFTTFDSDANWEDLYSGIALSPRVLYQSLDDGAFSWGVGLRAIIPLRSRDCTEEFNDQNMSDPLVRYTQCRNGNPLFVLAEIPLGWYY